jgi:hypothetical protein
VFNQRGVLISTQKQTQASLTGSQLEAFLILG